MNEQEKPLTVPQFSDLLVRRAKSGKDVVVAFTGDEGDGKSALANGIAMHADPLFTFHRNCLFSPTEDELSQKIRSLPYYSPIVADEAINILYKLNWASKGQKYLNRLYALCRKEYKINLMCMPRFIDFNEFFRNHRIRLWVHVIDPISKLKSTGHAVVLMRSWSPAAADPWWLKDMQKSIDTYSKRHRLAESEFDLGRKFDLLHRLRNFVGVIRFNWLDAEVWKEYEAIKEKVDYGSLEEEGSPAKVQVETKEFESPKAIKYRAYLKSMAIKLRELGMKNNEIAQMLGVSPSAVSSWLI